MGEDVKEGWVQGPESAQWESPHNAKQNRIAEKALAHSPHVQKLTGVKIGYLFPDGPSWWVPKNGASKGSNVWNCKRYSEFLRCKGFVIIASGERIGSPWFVVVHEQHCDDFLLQLVAEASARKSSNVPKASGQAAARAADAESPAS